MQGIPVVSLFSFHLDISISCPVTVSGFWLDFLSDLIDVENDPLPSSRISMSFTDILISLP